MYEPLSEAQLAEIHSQVQRYLEGNLEEISVVSIRQVQAVFAQFKLAAQKLGQKVKAQLCQTYNLVEKDQRANTAGIKETGSRDSTEDVKVGSFDASNQSQKNTQRPSSTKTKTKKSTDKQSQSKRRGDGSPASRKSAPKSKPKAAQTPEREEESPESDTESQDTQESQPPGNEPVQLDSTPTKAESFEDFKVGPGSKINRILKENKAVLLERRSLLQQLTEEVNGVKRDIDCTTASIQQQETRGDQAQYLVLEEEEPDATSLMQLRELKGLYRQRYEVLHDIKAEVNYCQHLVDQCRVHLLSEFENWYEKAFTVPEEEEITKDKTLEQGEDNQWPCELLPDDSESFYNARYRMLKRRNSSGKRRLPRSPC